MKLYRAFWYVCLITLFLLFSSNPVFSQDLTAPSVTILWPPPDTNLRHGVIMLPSARAVDDLSGVRDVTFFVDGRFAGTDNSPSGDNVYHGIIDGAGFDTGFDTGVLSIGQHVMQVNATDFAGNVGMASVLFNLVEGCPPGIVVEGCTPPLVLPHITAISPASAPVGTLVTITGENFGDVQGTSTVTFESTAISIRALVSVWSDTLIEVAVPDLPPGTYSVVVTTSVGSSNPVNFKIIRVPVLIVPGILASWSRELFCNDDNAVNDVEFWLNLFTSLDITIPTKWTIDPILGTYLGLKAEIVQADIPGIDVPYDWRMAIHDIVNTFLIPKIDQIKIEFGIDKVDIVAHSMGGLVVRHYIQSSTYRFDIRKFAMIGAPNQGSVDAYFMWEGGNFEPGISALPLDRGVLTRVGERLGLRFLFERILENMKQGCGRGGDPDVRFIRDFIPSIGQLMPTFPFISRFFSLIPVEEMCLRNEFLLNLNNSVINLIESGVSSKIFASSSERTLERIGVTLFPSCNRERWPDGEPRNRVFQIMSGDERVLLKQSAYPVQFIQEFSQIPLVEVTGKHGDLPDMDTVTNLVVEFLIK